MAYIGINNVAREATEIYIGVNGVARRVVKGYVGDGTGIARMWWGSSFIPGPDPEPDVPSGDYPVLNRLWADPIEGSKGSIIRITLVDSHTPTTEPDLSWAADENDTGAIMGYKYGTEIIIAGNGSGKIKAPADSNRLFSSFISVGEISGLNILDTSDVVNMESMFRFCEALTSLNLDGWNTRKVTTMYAMFEYCTALPLLDLSSFETDSVTTMMSIFANCINLKTIYVGDGWQIDYGRVNATNMFLYCGCRAVTHK